MDGHCERCKYGECRRDAKNPPRRAGALGARVSCLDRDHPRLRRDPGHRGHAGRHDVPGWCSGRNGYADLHDADRRLARWRFVLSRPPAPGAIRDQDRRLAVPANPALPHGPVRARPARGSVVADPRSHHRGIAAAPPPAPVDVAGHGVRPAPAPDRAGTRARQSVHVGGRCRVRGRCLGMARRAGGTQADARAVRSDRGASTVMVGRSRCAGGGVATVRGIVGPVRHGPAQRAEHARPRLHPRRVAADGGPAGGVARNQGTSWPSSRSAGSERLRRFRHCFPTSSQARRRQPSMLGCARRQTFAIHGHRTSTDSQSR